MLQVRSCEVNGFYRNGRVLAIMHLSNSTNTLQIDSDKPTSMNRNTRKFGNSSSRITEHSGDCFTCYHESDGESLIPEAGMSDCPPETKKGFAEGKESPAKDASIIPQLHTL